MEFERLQLDFKITSVCKGFWTTEIVTVFSKPMGRVFIKFMRTPSLNGLVLWPNTGKYLSLPVQ